MIDDGEELLRLIENHIAHGRYREADLPTGEFAVVAGFLPISREGDVVRIGDAALVEPDIPASNGILHVVDAVNTEVCFRIGDAEELTCQHLGDP
jgi:uncharacterized surface protein with fasciclin (FAS1) repeats